MYIGQFKNAQGTQKALISFGLKLRQKMDFDTILGLRVSFSLRPREINMGGTIKYFTCEKDFDVNECRWQTESDSCDDYVTELDVTFSGEEEVCRPIKKYETVYFLSIALTVYILKGSLLQYNCAF